MLFVAADHAGWELKNQILEYLSTTDLEFRDLGAFVKDLGDDYVDFAFELAANVSILPSSTGILICRSGEGMSIAANKVKGVYAALCHDTMSAEKSREHNDANVLILESTISDPLKIVETFITTKFSGDERHVRRIAKIKNYENHYLKQIDRTSLDQVPNGDIIDNDLLQNYV